MTGKALAVLLAVSLLSSGCSEPTIDGSGEVAFYHSAGRMAISLEDDEREAFTEALMVVAMDGVDFTAELASGEQLDFEAAIARLDGMSVEEIIAMAESLQRSERDRR